jgi:Restriction endonuclease
MENEGVISMIIAVDFDGTLFEDEFPEIGEPITSVIEVIKILKKFGHKIILWTCRCGDDLQAAINACYDAGIQFDAINENLPEQIEKYNNDCRKISADIYIDDKSLDPQLINKLRILEMKSKRSKACDISAKTKLIVWNRDGGKCILCESSVAMPNAHYIPRSKGGLGIEQNVVTLCIGCHFKLDQTIQRKELLKEVKEHLDKHYPDFTDEQRIYKKG